MKVSAKVRVIGLYGKAGTGKDTVAGFMKLRYGFYPIALADPIRDGLVAMFNLPRFVLVSREWKEAGLAGFNGVSPRELMQTLGTEWARRVIGDDIWLKVAERRINTLAAADRDITVVVTDVRFPNEADWVRKLGGTMVRIIRPDAEAVRDHESERGIPYELIDYDLLNVGSLEDLKDKVADMVELLDSQEDDEQRTCWVDA